MTLEEILEEVEELALSLDPSTFVYWGVIKHLDGRANPERFVGETIAEVLSEIEKQIK